MLTPVVAAGVLACCARRAAPGPRMSLRVSAAHRLSMCPFYVAYETDYFSQAGFDVDLLKDQGTAQSLPLLAGGKLDVSLTSYGPPVINGVVRGARLRVVAGREVVSKSCGTAGTIFVTRKAHPQGVQSMRQIKGARIALSNSPQTEFWFDTLVEHEGMRPSDFSIKKMGEAERILALRSGSVDAYVSTESDFSPELRPLGLVAGPAVASVMPNYQFSHIMFGPTLVDAPVETGARFLRAYFRGVADFLRGATPQFMINYAKENDLDPVLIRQGCRQTFERDGSVHMDDLRRYTEWMAAHDLCPANADVAAIVDSRFLEAAHRSSDF
jgi:NitT/TauT family transport system substrate-binding protein